MTLCYSLCGAHRKDKSEMRERLGRFCLNSLQDAVSSVLSVSLQVESYVTLIEEPNLPPLMLQASA